MEVRNLNSWQEFKNELSALRSEHEQLRGSDESVLLFRGQPDACWLLKTTLDRRQERMRVLDYYRLVGRIKPEIESMTGVEWPIPDFPEIEKLSQGYENLSFALGFGRWPGYGYMAPLRHHGFPSPLLDWTRCPYVAAFFAFRDATANRVSIYILSRPCFHVTGNQMNNVFYPGPYVTTHRRHVLQQSQYTFCVAYDSEWRFGSYDAVFDQGVNQQGTCWKLTTSGIGSVPSLKGTGRLQSKCIFPLRVRREPYGDPKCPRVFFRTVGNQVPKL
jgi:hypothetical protein